MKGKVAMIVPFFGTWPQWFDLFLLSCSHQSGLIDYYFFTDCGKPSTVYENTFFNQIEFYDYCDSVSSSLGISFHPKSPYKLTDLKPFLGHIHKDVVIDYDFWAFGDIDLIFGDMSIVLSPPNLCKNDFITTHSERVAGHFTAIRVSSPMFDKCFSIIDWKSKLEEERHIGLDEGDYSTAVNPSIRTILGIIRRILGDTDDDRKRKICSAVWRYCPILCQKKCFQEFYTTPVPDMTSSYCYDTDKGTMIDVSTLSPIPYLHFLFFKKTPYLKTETYWDESSFYNVPSMSRLIKITREGINGIV